MVSDYDPETSREFYKHLLSYRLPLQRLAVMAMSEIGGAAASPVSTIATFEALAGRTRNKLGLIRLDRIVQRYKDRIQTVPGATSHGWITGI